MCLALQQSSVPRERERERGGFSEGVAQPVRLGPCQVGGKGSRAVRHFPTWPPEGPTNPYPCRHALASFCLGLGAGTAEAAAFQGCGPGTQVSKSSNRFPEMARPSFWKTPSTNHKGVRNPFDILRGSVLQDLFNKFSGGGLQRSPRGQPAECQGAESSLVGAVGAGEIFRWDLGLSPNTRDSILEETKRQRTGLRAKTGWFPRGFRTIQGLPK